MVNIAKINDFKEKLEAHISSTNEKHLSFLENKKDNNIIATKENLSIAISQGILEDLDTILLLDSNKVQERYIDYIIRGLVEHVIEYKFLILNDGLIDEYFGGKIKSLSRIGDKFNVVKEMKKLGGGRYVHGRKKINIMAEGIKEIKSTDGTLSLYDIFCIASEEAHNSYFNGYLDCIENEQTVNSLTELHVTFIYTIINKFLETYDYIL